MHWHMHLTLLHNHYVAHLQSAAQLESVLPSHCSHLSSYTGEVKLQKPSAFLQTWWVSFSLLSFSYRTTKHSTRFFFVETSVPKYWWFIVRTSRIIVLNTCYKMSASYPTVFVRDPVLSINSCYPSQPSLWNGIAKWKNFSPQPLKIRLLHAPAQQLLTVTGVSGPAEQVRQVRQLPDQ